MFNQFNLVLVKGLGTFDSFLGMAFDYSGSFTNTTKAFRASCACIRFCIKYGE